MCDTKSSVVNAASMKLGHRLTVACSFLRVTGGATTRRVGGSIVEACVPPRRLRLVPELEAAPLTGNDPAFMCSPLPRASALLMWSYHKRCACPGATEALASAPRACPGVGAPAPVSTSGDHAYCSFIWETFPVLGLRVGRLAAGVVTPCSSCSEQHTCLSPFE